MYLVTSVIYIVGKVLCNVDLGEMITNPLTIRVKNVQETNCRTTMRLFFHPGQMARDYIDN